MLTDDLQLSARLLVSFPLAAAMTLFSYVIANPLCSSASSDIGLMEVVDELFGRLELLSSGVIVLCQSRECTRLARMVVGKANTPAERDFRGSEPSAPIGSDVWQEIVQSGSQIEEGTAGIEVEVNKAALSWANDTADSSFFTVNSNSVGMADYLSLEGQGVGGGGREEELHYQEMRSMSELHEDPSTSLQRWIMANPDLEPGGHILDAGGGYGFGTQ